MQIESARKSVTTVTSTPDRDLLPPTDEQDGDI